jgi:RND family efflux transporter MFP subunit
MSDQLSSDLASLRIQRDAPPRRSVLTYVIGFVGAVVLLGCAYAFGAPYIEAKVFRPEVSATEIMLVSPAQSSVNLTATGYVIAEVKSKVGTKVQGRLAKLYVREGDTVKAGQMIAELDDAEQQSAIRTARAKVATAKARLELSRAKLAENKLQAERQRVLAERNAAPKATAEDLGMRVKSLGESARAAEAEVASAEAEVESLSVTLRDMKIVAPINGRVVEKVTDVGESVVPGGAAIVELADFATLIVEVDVPEARLHHVKVGGPCEIVLDAYPGRRYRCATREIVPRVNRAKATVPVKVRFVDDAEGVLPEMAARASFLDKELDANQMKEPPHLVVPQNAVADRAGAKMVFVLDGDQVRMTPVSLGQPMAGGFELEQGPPAGTKIVKSPPPTLDDGARIKERN